jgi:SAM-dependent methyltransferase
MLIRDTVKRIVGRRGRLLVRRLRTSRWPITRAYRDRLRGMRALEIGGPSDVLGFGGAFPIYSCLAVVHNCNFSDRTLWGSEAVKYAQTIVCEGTAVRVESGTYDCVIASHCLEHVANPIKALLEWRRALRREGVLLLILPHRDFTFDRRRPVTTLAHMREDFERGTQENDLTHLPEILSLHDLSCDPGAGEPEQFRERCLNNDKFRAMHHHVFLPETAMELVREAGFSILRQDVQAENIVILAKNP